MNLWKRDTWWVITKVVSLFFTSIATYNIFHKQLTKSITTSIFFIPKETAIDIAVIAAFLLVDLLFIMLVTFLESEQTQAGWGMVFSLWTLYAFIVIIGIKDEGVLAFAPRIGLGVLALTATLRYVTAWWEWRDQTWEERSERQRNRREYQDRVSFLEKQRRVKNKARQTALTNLEEELIEEYRSQYIDQLLRKADLLEDTRPEPLQLEPSSEYVKPNGKGFIWVEPDTGEEHHTSALGKPYSEVGAKKALARHLRGK